MSDDDTSDAAPLVAPWSRGPDSTLLETRIFTVLSQEARSPDGSRHGTFYRIDTHDWVNVVALTAAGELVMIEQYRHGLGRVTLEIPGGVVEPGEDPLAAGLRELAEETGYVGRDAALIGRASANPAIQTNWCHTVRVRDVELTRAPALDEHEDIAVRLVPMAEVRELIVSGAIHHALVVVALAHHWLGEG